MRLGLGDGTFGPSIAYGSGRGSFGIRLADLSLDGRLDIAVASYLDSTLRVFVGAGDGTVGAAAPYPMGSRRLRYVDAVLAADFDRDGRLDVATPGNGGAAVRRGRGDGAFFGLQSLDPGPHGLTTQGGAVGDFNGDGWPDLAVAVACDAEECFDGDSYSVSLYLNWSGQRAPPCVVPYTAAYNLRLPRARRLVRRAGCRIGHIRRRYSRNVDRGHVIAQRPRPSRVLPSHGRVDLVVSRGRRR